MARVKEIMLNDAPTLKKEAKIEEAAKLLAQKEIGCVVVVEDGMPAGIVTELDFIRHFVSKGKGLKEPVNRIMSSPVVSIPSDMKLDGALKIIDAKKFRRYPVVENGQFIGLATQKDVVQRVSDNIKLHRNIQNAVLLIFVLFELFIFVFYEYFYAYLHFGV